MADNVLHTEPVKKAFILYSSDLPVGENLFQVLQSDFQRQDENRKVYDSVEVAIRDIQFQKPYNAIVAVVIPNENKSPVREVLYALEATNGSFKEPILRVNPKYQVLFQHLFMAGDNQNITGIKLAIIHLLDEYLKKTKTLRFFEMHKDNWQSFSQQIGDAAKLPDIENILREHLARSESIQNQMLIKAISSVMQYKPDVLAQIGVQDVHLPSLTR